MIDHSDAKIIIQEKRGISEGAIIEMVVWELPQPTSERPHGYKYRLNYYLADGTTLVRYDNKTGKGDHKHIGEIQMAYDFRDVPQLLVDFINDVIAAGGLS
jgi:hypothetical protein